MISYVISAVLSWVSLAYLVLIHSSRIVEGKSLGVFGVMIAIAGFCVSLPFYAIGTRSKLKVYHHLAYWIPILAAIVMGAILKVTFAP